VTVYTTNYDVDVEPDVCHSVDGVRVYYFRRWADNYIGEVSLKMYRMMKENIPRFDCIYITPVWSPVLWYPMRFISKTDIPFIISPRGGLYPEVVRKKNFFIKKLAFQVIRPYVEKANFIHYTTENEREKVESYWKIKTPAFVIPNGVELKNYDNLPPKGFFKKKFGIEGHYILHLGRISWIKGLDITAKTFSMLLEKYPDLQWIVAGRDDGYKNILLEQLKKLGCENRVRFVGLLQGEDKLGALVDADMFVLPSYSENFGMAVVEAMACGVPVIISNKVGIYREVEKYNAGIVVDTEVESLYRGMRLLLENHELREKISTNGKKLVKEHYDIEKVADRMIEVYKAILKSKTNT